MTEAISAQIYWDLFGSGHSYNWFLQKPLIPAFLPGDTRDSKIITHYFFFSELKGINNSSESTDTPIFLLCILLYLRFWKVDISNTVTWEMSYWLLNTRKNNLLSGTFPKITLLWKVFQVFLILYCKPDGRISSVFQISWDCPIVLLENEHIFFSVNDLIGLSHCPEDTIIMQ